MLKIALSAAVFMSLSAHAALAAPFVPGAANSIAAQSDHVTLAASRTKKPAGQTAQAFKGNGRTVKDTCPGNNQACINELIKNCDKAGGGLSTWEDGSVDCYVVGIHDQP